MILAVRRLFVAFVCLLAVGVSYQGASNASAAGTVPDPGPTPALSISRTLSVAPGADQPAKQFIVGFRDTTTDPDTYIKWRSTGDTDLGLTWGGYEFCPFLSAACDEQVLIDINGDAYFVPYQVSQGSLGYTVKLDWTDVDAPEPQVGDLVTIKFAAGAFEMPDPSTNFEPFIRFDFIRTNGTNFVLEDIGEATVATLPDSPDTPEAPTATPGNGNVTVTITPNSSGEEVSKYRITSEPDGSTCDITPPATSCVVEGLENGTSYSFTAVALNAGFPSASSLESAPVVPSGPASSNDSSSGSSSPEVDGQEGIFLTVLASPGDRIYGADVLFGSYAIAANSPYLLSWQGPSSVAVPRILQQGRVNSGGHLEEQVAVPSAAIGTYKLVLSGTSSTGEPLRLTNVITVDSGGNITYSTPESMQPYAR